ncbi:uncharacterized protein PFLUO_LOCUS2885 [Penicillium psychrofluorescens]|uniref:uncharacterized protein n=1 Tax=Penicillium psychrofluorescens TaxID=3158075 RepID=UPI003CCD98F0
MEDPTWQDHDADVLHGLMPGCETMTSLPSDLFDPFKNSGLPFGDSLLDGYDGLTPLHSDLPYKHSDLDFGDSLLDLHLQQPEFWSSAGSYDLYSSQYTTTSQDAWNPLQITGVPANNPCSSLSHMNADFYFSNNHNHYGPPSECESQYMSSLHSDSGYGTASCATPSLVPSSYGVEMTSSPSQMDTQDQTTCLFNQSSPSHMYTGSVKCEYPRCSWVGKCLSDKRKHNARHQKRFKCDEPNCSRKEGFGTINDLARHKKCVHNKEPERGPKMVYVCLGTNCPRPNKKWPRLDNFRQHLARMHGDEDADVLLKRSMDWYEASIACSDTQSVSHNDEDGRKRKFGALR